MENLNVVDYVIVGVIGISIIVSIARGLITEVFSLFVWVGAFLGAVFFYEDVAKFLPNLFGSNLIPNISGNGGENLNEVVITAVVSFAVTFLGLLFLLGLINLFISFLIRHLKISIYDRLLGVIFGALRGAFIIAAITLFVINSPLKENVNWKESTLAPNAEQWAKLLSSFTPADFLDRINSDKLIKNMREDNQFGNINLDSYIPRGLKKSDTTEEEPLTQIQNSDEEIPEEESPISVIDHE